MAVQHPSDDEPKAFRSIRQLLIGLGFRNEDFNEYGAIRLGGLWKISYRSTSFLRRLLLRKRVCLKDIYRDNIRIRIREEARENGGFLMNFGEDADMAPEVRKRFQFGKWHRFAWLYASNPLTWPPSFSRLGPPPPAMELASWFYLVDDSGSRWLLNTVALTYIDLVDVEFIPEHLFHTGLGKLLQLVVNQKRHDAS